MSKSNIKNINSLSSNKTSFLLYNKTTYTDLIFRLKKNSVWRLNRNFIINKLLFPYTRSLQTLVFIPRLQKNTWRYKYFNVNVFYIQYNPNTVNIEKFNSELFIFKKFKKFKSAVDLRKKNDLVDPHIYYWENASFEDCQPEDKKKKKCLIFLFNQY